MAFLRSIRLRGFKTFARSTEIVVEPGITVIIGPNGSGKSNIADAVLWALGEQSPTAIRGRSMQDVIFAGSEERGSAPGAEVTLHFDNSSEAFPVPYDEVEISRAVGRDGASAYRVNGSTVRLTDVQELIAAVGLGREMHSVISQGKVEEFLTSTPLTRRSLVEEASGLGRYKKRRQRAQNKLEKVRANLDRVLDIEEEVKKALRPLRQQVTAAERFAEVTEELAEMKARLLLAELRDIETESAEREARRQEIVAARAQADAELEDIRRARAEEEREFTESMRVREELSAGYHRARAEGERLHSRETAIGERLGRLRSEADRTGRRREMAADDLRHAQARIAGLGESPAVSGGRLARVERAAETLDAETGRIRPLVERAHAETEALRDEIFELESGRSRLTQERDVLRRELEDRGRRAKELDSEEKAARARLSAAQEAVSRLAADRRESLESLSRAEAASAEADQRLKAVRAELESAKEEERELRDRHADLEGRRRVLEGFLSRREGVPAAAKRMLEERADSTLVIEVLDVDAGYESAVAAALGPLANAVVQQGAWQPEVVSASDGALEVLWPENASDVGRDDGAGRRVSDAGRSLWEVVAGPRPVLDALRSLLGEVVLVEHPPAAEGPPGVGAAAGNTVVTKEGDVFHGRVHAARRGDPGTGAVLSARSELESLRRRLQTVAAERESLGRRLGDVQRAATEAAREAETADHRRREAGRVAAGVEDEGEVCSRRAEEAGGDLASVLARRERETESISSVEAQLAATEVGLQEHHDRLEAARDGLSGARARAETLQEQLGRLNSKRSQAALLLARLRERRRAFEDEWGRAVTARDTAVRLCESLDARRRVLDDTLPAVQELHRVTTALVEEFGSRIEAMGRRAESSRRSSDEFADVLKEHSRKEADLQRRLADLSEQLVESQVALAHLEDRSEERLRGLADLRRRHLSPREVSPEDVSETSPEELRGEVERLERRRDRIGPVNPLAEQEYRDTAERAQFLADQRRDLQLSLDEIEGVIAGLDEHIQTTFGEVFEATRAHFQDMVEVLFPGGKGLLRLVDADSLTRVEDGEPGEEETGDGGEEETTEDSTPMYARQGIVVEIKLPKKAPRSMSLLSGGEKALSAIAFLFSLFLASPSAFYILDEVEAALDDVNIGRFLSLVRRYQERTQFIIITHQKRTMEIADTLYGVAMDEDGTSRVLSRRLRRVAGD